MPTCALLGEEKVAGLNQDFLSGKFPSIRGTSADRGNNLQAHLFPFVLPLKQMLAPNLTQEVRERMLFRTHFAPEQVRAGRPETRLTNALCLVIE